LSLAAVRDLRDVRSSAGPDELAGQCCIGRSVRVTERADENDRLSDGHRELAEGCACPVAGGDIDGEFIMTAAEILDERVPGRDDPRGPVALQAAHRPEPGFQPPVISLDRIVRITLDYMQCRGDQLVEDPRIGRDPVGGDLGRDRARSQRRLSSRDLSREPGSVRANHVGPGQLRRIPPVVQPYVGAGRRHPGRCSRRLVGRRSPGRP